MDELLLMSTIILAKLILLVHYSRSIGSAKLPKLIPFECMRNKNCYIIGINDVTSSEINPFILQYSKENYILTSVNFWRSS